jgi:hypothetical protein
MLPPLRNIGARHEANMKAIVAVTTEEKANAAASVAAAGQREGSMRCRKRCNSGLC